MIAKWWIAFAPLLAILFSALQPVHPFGHNENDAINVAAPGRVLLLTAHPDDECLFFAPTVLALVASNVEVYSLCLSMGDADGLGSVRKHELESSLDVLGVPEGKRLVIDRPDLQDDIKSMWDSDVIASVVEPYVLQHQISTILTFDQQGISSHPNHISLPIGVSRMLSRSKDTTSRPHLYTLVSVPLYKKYIGLLGPVLAKLSVHTRRLIFHTDLTSKSGDELVFVAGAREFATAHRAMQQHWSQLVWFRWLYVLFSRYMWVNEWVEVSSSGVEDTAA